MVCHELVRRHPVCVLDAKDGKKDCRRIKRGHADWNAMKASTHPMVCRLVDGVKRLVFVNQNRYAAMLAKLGEGEMVTVTFSQKRDTKHNSKLHGVLAEVADALGWETDEFKEFIVTKLRPLDECPITGFVRRQKTHEMSDEEIDALVMEIKAWTFHHMPGFVFEFDAQYRGVTKAA